MPTEDKVTRKLRAILSADVKGYSLLMTDDEAFTVKTLKEYRAVMSDLIGQHTGRVVDDPGDNLLAEFASVVDAVRCAVEIQKVLKENNEKLPTEKRLEFRIGVNIGDVIQDQDRLYGEGVNIAARIEGLAEPGGVCISRNAYDHIRDKLNLGYEYLGEREVKNIKQPVRVYKVLMAPEDAGKLIGDVPKSGVGNWKWAAVVVITIIVTSILWLISKEKPAKTEIPSIAVLPFVNMSNDSEHEYFIDGMTDELINDLTKIKNLRVISRNSAFTYKGKSIKVQQIANDLNVRYILEGSVQRSGDNLRIRAQLIDGKTDHHLWSESYDGVMDDMFELQDKITGKIVSALAVKLSAPELNTISDKGTKNPLAHEAYLKGQTHLRLWTPDDLVAAIDLFESALELDPEFSQVYTALASAYWNNIMGGREYYAKTGKEYAESKVFMRHYINLSMENPTPKTYELLAFLELQRRNFDQAILHANKALFLAPNDADILRTIGIILIHTGQPDRAIYHLDKSMKLDPFNRTFEIKTRAYFVLGKYEEAANCFENSITKMPDLVVGSPSIAATYAFLGQEVKAKKALETWLSKFLGPYPDTQTLYIQYTIKDDEVFNRLVNGLIKAGWKADPKAYYPIQKENKLDGQEIKPLVFGKTLSGTLFGSYEWSNKITDDGNVMASNNLRKTVDKGKVWIESDLLCYQYEKRWGGIKYCCDVYRNKKGDRISKSEYLLMGDIWTFPFSVFE